MWICNFLCISLSLYISLCIFIGLTFCLLVLCFADVLYVSLLYDLLHFWLRPLPGPCGSRGDPPLCEVNQSTDGRLYHATQTAPRTIRLSEPVRRWSEAYLEQLSLLQPWLVSWFNFWANRFKFMPVTGQWSLPLRTSWKPMQTNSSRYVHSVIIVLDWIGLDWWIVCLVENWCSGCIVVPQRSTDR